MKESMKTMNHRISGLTLCLVAVAVAGCSGNIIPESRKIEYKSAGKVPTLEVPPDLTQLSRDDRYLVPDDAGKGSATFSAYAAERTPEAQAGQSAVLPKVDKVRVERSSIRHRRPCGTRSRSSGRKPVSSSTSNDRKPA